MATVTVNAPCKLQTDGSDAQQGIVKLFVIVVIFGDILLPVAVNTPLHAYSGFDNSRVCSVLMAIGAFGLSVQGVVETAVFRQAVAALPDKLMLVIVYFKELVNFRTSCFITFQNVIVTFHAMCGIRNIGGFMVFSFYMAIDAVNIVGVVMKVM